MKPYCKPQDCEKFADYLAVLAGKKKEREGRKIEGKFAWTFCTSSICLGVGLPVPLDSLKAHCAHVNLISTLL